MKRLKLKNISEASAIAQTLEVLQAGGLVIFPTETTYGAGVNALNPQAVQKLLQYKSRREGKPLSIAVPSLEVAEEYVAVSASAKSLYAQFLPGPVTIVSKSKGKVAPGVESEFGTLGIRIPDYPFILNLLTQYKQPITATSANASDAKRPYTIEDILENLSAKQLSLIDLILDAGELPHNPPSTVIDTTLSTPVVFRQGQVQVTNPTSVTNLTSYSEEETKSIAGKILLKRWNDVKKTGLIIGLNGSLGMGKTIFAKGVAEFLQIPDQITSPTYSYLQEYEFNRHAVKGIFFHLDVWKIDDPQEMERLEFDHLLGPNHVIVIEWAQKVADYLKQLHQIKETPYLEVNFSHQAEGSTSDLTRQLEIKE